MDEGKKIENVKSLDEVNEAKYVRVGCAYYKKIVRPDRHGIQRAEYAVWKKDEIALDHGKDFLKGIPKYDAFIVSPSNKEYKAEVEGGLNLYSRFEHTPRKGEWTWTKRLLEHVFGDQYDLGLRYMQILYLHPERSTVILALVSKERQTGKTTFLNWINALFGGNVVLISSSDFLGGFNGHYASKNIICIEETLLEKNLTLEKLKAITTAKYLQVNEKFVNSYKLPFYGKVILTSNNEDKFAKIEPEEVRFFVRKLGTPKIGNHNIETDLVKEIPAFLHYLESLTPVDWSVSRSGFTPQELSNEALRNVVSESMSELHKIIFLFVVDHFYNSEMMTEFFATAKDVWERWFTHNSKFSAGYILRVLKNEFNFKTQGMQRYYPFGEGQEKTGTPFHFKREDFLDVKM